MAMACDGDGVEFEIVGVEQILCKGCPNCKPRPADEEVSDGGEEGGVVVS
jgi:hypothetical protein